MGTFKVSQRSNGEFQFNLVAGNGVNILTSEGYSTKAACTNGVESVKKNSTDKERFEVKTSSNGKHYFNLKAGNGQVIGTSQMYADADNCNSGIEAVMNNAPNATVEEV